MAIGLKDYGSGAAVIELGASTAAGSYTVYPASREGPFLKTDVYVETDTKSGWNGVVTITPKHATIAETATTVATGDTTTSGTAGYKLNTFTGLYTEIAIVVATNNKVMRVYVKSYGPLEVGAL